MVPSPLSSRSRSAFQGEHELPERIFNPMDFHQLKVFVEVARQKSFSRAAETIFLTQPTVSAHIKALENEVGTLLLDRSQRELQLTDAGKVLLRYARQLLAIKEEAIFATQEERRVIDGHLEIASSSVPGAYILPELMSSFLEKHPAVTFAVMLRDTRQVYENVREYSYDLGFVGEPALLDGLEQVQLLQDELVLIAAPGTRLSGERAVPEEAAEGWQSESPAQGKNEGGVAGSSSKFPSPLFELDLNAGDNAAELLQLPFVMREPGSATRLVFENALEEYYGQNKTILQVIAYLESQEAIKEAVKTGLGVTVISRHAVKDELAAGLLKGYRLAGLELERSFYLIYHQNRILSPLSRAFLEHCADCFSGS